MPDPSRITQLLHPTDFSAACERALGYAQLLCQLTDAELHVVHVIAFSEGIKPSERALKAARTAAEKRLAELCDTIEGVRSVRRSVQIGTPHTEVIAYARHAKIDLVVMGTVGLTGETRGSVGSTAEKVIRGLDVPVLTVKGSAKAKVRVCSLCAKPAQDVLCDACKDRVRGEAVHHKYASGRGSGQ